MWKLDCENLGQDKSKEVSVILVLCCSRCDCAFEVDKMDITTIFIYKPSILVPIGTAAHYLALVKMRTLTWVRA